MRVENRLLTKTENTLSLRFSNSKIVKCSSRKFLKFQKFARGIDFGKFFKYLYAKLILKQKTFIYFSLCSILPIVEQLNKSYNLVSLFSMERKTRDVF